MRAGAGMVRAVDARALDGVGAPDEVVRRPLPAVRLGGRGARRRSTASTRSSSGPGSGASRRDGRRACATVVAAAAAAAWSTATACSRWPGTPTAPRTLLRRRTAPTVLTPHDGEYGLLTGTPPGADRLRRRPPAGRRHRRRRAAQGPEHRRRRARRRRARGRQRRRPAGHRRHRRRARPGIIGALAGRRAATRSTPPRPARGSTPRRPAAARRPGWSPATSSSALPACSPSSVTEPT